MKTWHKVAELYREVTTGCNPTGLLYCEVTMGYNPNRFNGKHVARLELLVGAGGSASHGP